MGAVQGGSKVIYDRANSAIATIEPDVIDWHQVFADVSKEAESVVRQVRG